MKAFAGIFTSFAAMIVMLFLASCQKEAGGGNNNTNNQKPKVGTTWIYRYYTYYVNGGLATSGTMTHKAKNVETIGGETWLNVVDIATDTTVYKLREKSDGLHQYTNSNSYLFCKNPATLNETYSTYNKGVPEDFTVKKVRDSLDTDIGKVLTNYYEGFVGGEIKDEIWFNANAWIVRHQTYRKPPLGTNYRYTALFLQSITY